MTTGVPAPATTDNRTATQKYIDDVAPSSIVGRLIKFTKEGQFVTVDDAQPIDPQADFIAICDETLAGWIKFSRDGGPPERVEGLLFDGFILPARETLGDTDEAAWLTGITGAPTDPWLHQLCLVLQRRDTAELFTFSTTSASGRRAAGNLLKHYERLARSGSNEVPVVKLRSGGFHHKNPRVGWIPTPSFVVVGSAPRDSAAKPAPTSEDMLQDQVPV
jgi:hypothetical protein